MTLKEIEEIVRTLEKRHSNLNETMLVTLLRAGGWEEKTIKDAQILFRTQQSTAHTRSIGVEALPTLQVNEVLPPPVPLDHLLPDPEKEVLTKEVAPAPVLEPQSLVVEVSTEIKNKEGKKVELPHNLPLRPFETSEHIWPFSRYKDVFYGDIDVHHEVESSTQEHEKVNMDTKPQAAVDSKPQTEKAPQIITQIAEKKVDVSTHSPSPEIKEVIKVKDDKAVVMASAMLLAILLLLGYMYSNGRL